MNGLLIITHTAAQLTDLRYEACFRKRRRGGARLWEQVRPHLSDLTFRLLSRCVDCLTIRIAIGVLKSLNVRASWNSLRAGEGLPVANSETEWIKVSVEEPPRALAEPHYRHDRVRLYSGDRLVEHGLSLLGRAPCCANATVESVRADTAPTISVRNIGPSSVLGLDA